MKHLIDIISTSKSLKLLIIFIILDVLFGVARSFIEHKSNSTIGINGIIRKVLEIVTIITCIIIDEIIDLNFVSFVSSELKEFLGIKRVGITFIFNSLYIVFEILSIFKNMYKCKLPLPKKLKDFLERILKEYTEEL